MQIIPRTGDRILLNYQRTKEVTMRRTVAILLSMMLVMAFAVPVMAAEEMAEPAPVKIGDMLPDDLSATTLDGESVMLKNALTDADYTIFQFMTTACSACQAELQEFVAMQAEMGKDKVGIISIAMDLLGVDAVNAYESKYKYGVTYMLDTDFVLPPRFNFAYTPSFFIADKSGKVLYMKGGFMQSRWAKERKKIEGIMQ
jgi:thiol-disulfide isomerase/thioredoxin